MNGKRKANGHGKAKESKEPVADVDSEATEEDIPSAQSGKGGKGRQPRRGGNVPAKGRQNLYTEDEMIRLASRFGVIKTPGERLLEGLCEALKAGSADAAAVTTVKDVFKVLQEQNALPLPPGS